MLEDLVATKLHIPQPRAAAISRPRLADQIGRSPVTLLSAPAGSGKTTLVSEWAGAGAVTVAWVSLENADNDPARFWSYVIAGMKTLEPDVGDSALALLRSPQPAAIESVLTALINEISTLPTSLVIVLDNYHVIESEAIHVGLLFLIDHLPPTMRLVITSRSDPPLPLARLRASGRLTDVRDADLRFTEEEASTFLNRAMGLDLSPGLVAILETRTEGWAVGLQMAAISMQGRENVAEFIDDFSGSNRYILDYLTQEVLERQPADVQAFLLRTSILERLNGPLCDAVTSRRGGQAILEQLERDNIFTMPLDEDRRWYRYHYLFAESLRRLLRQRHAGELTELRRRAAAWFEHSGLVWEAIDHALAAADYENAARLIEHEADQTLWRDSQRITVANWLGALPPDLVRSHPKLGLVQAWAKFTTGDWETVEPLLEEVELALSQGDDAVSAGAISGEVAAIRSGIAYETGSMHESTELARQALRLLPDDNPTVRAVVSFQLGLSSFFLGDLEAARQNYAEAVVAGRSAGNVTIALLAAGCQVQLAVRLGHLREAAEFYQQARHLGHTKSGVSLAPVGLACVQIGEVYRECNELDEAERVLQEGIALCEQQGGMPEFVLEGLITLARVRYTRGDGDGTSAALRQAEELLAELRLRSGDVRPIISQPLVYRARLSLAQGDIAGAAHWAEDAQLDLEGEIDVVNQGAYVLLARVLLAQDQTADAVATLDRLLETASDDVSGVEPLIIKAVALGPDDPGSAQDALVQALPVGEHEGYVRVFLDEGETVRLLLQDIAAGSDKAPYVERLLGAFAGDRDTPVQPAAGSGAGSLLEPLNEREMTILRCMTAGLSNKDIAKELFLSVNTVKWHARNIYGKLGVSGRAKAVSLARELQIL